MVWKIAYKKRFKMNIYLILDVVILILGLYVVYASFKMKSTGKIAGSFLAEEDQKKVKDQKGYIDYIENKSCAFGVFTVVRAVVSVLSELVLKIPYWRYIEMVLFVIAIIFFSHVLRNSREKFVK